MNGCDWALAQNFLDQMKLRGLQVPDGNRGLKTLSRE